MAFSRLSRNLAFLLLAGLTRAAQACTVCDSPTGHQVRAGIFNGHFLHTFWLVAVPFPVFAVAVGLLHFGMPDLTLDTALPTPMQRDDSAPFAAPTLFAAAEPTS